MELVKAWAYDGIGGVAVHHDATNCLAVLEVTDKEHKVSSIVLTSVGTQGLIDTLVRTLARGGSDQAGAALCDSLVGLVKDAFGAPPEPPPFFLPKRCWCGKESVGWCATQSGDGFEVPACSEEHAHEVARRMRKGRVGAPDGSIGPEVAWDS